MVYFQKKNNANSTVDDNPLAQAATTLNVPTGEGANFPSAPFVITIWDKTTYSDPGNDPGMEICICTNRVSDALTITRGDENTADVEHTQGETVAMLVTSGLFNDSTYGYEAKIDLNTAKETNVSTALSVGTVGINTVAITSDGGADDVTLPAATVDTAGMLTTAKWAEIVANTAKETNATHTGEVTGATALTIAADAVTYAKMQNITTNNRLLGTNTGDNNIVEELEPSEIRTMINVADGADVTGDNTPKAHLLGAHTTDTLANLNSIVTDNTLIGTDDARLSDDRDPNAHAGEHTDGTDDIQSATNAVKGLATAAHIQAIEANTAKETNVSTALSVGTVGVSTVAITSDGGADDVTLPASTNAAAGMATAAQITKLEGIATGADVTGDNPPQTHAMSTHTDEGALSTLNTVGSSQIDTAAVTYEKIQNVVNDDVFLGRISGADGDVEEINKANALTLLNVADGADVTGDNPPKAHLLGAHTTDTLANLNSIITDATLIDTGDARLSDARTPTAHEASHKASGSDEILLDELGTPTDVTTLNSSTSAHGLLKKLDNVATNFMNGQGNWTAPAGGGSQTVNIYLPAEAAYLPETNPASLVEVAGSGAYAGWSYLAFDDTTSEHSIWRVPMPDYNGGNIIVTAYTKPATTPEGEVTLQFDILTIGLATSETFDAAVTVDTTVNLSQTMNTTELNTDICVITATIDPANVTADDLLVIELSRDVGSDNLLGDGQLLGIMLEYTRA